MKGKSKGTVWAVVILALITASLLSSCGDDDDGAASGTIILTIGADPDITFSGTADGVKAFYTAAGSPPIPPASTAVVAINGSDPDLAISFQGTTADTYSIKSGVAEFSCSDSSGNVYAAMEGLAHTSGSVVVTQMGSVGELIVGTFTFIADAYDGGDPSGDTVRITGSFEITRGSDI
ncbi:MAG: hypothetical protein JSU92_01460 [Deltaproteobacteria bacterium]|nr:MAG: hypothetical protein JSU92_01460 [Deltaproteobacteria bacterium]